MTSKTNEIKFWGPRTAWAGRNEDKNCDVGAVGLWRDFSQNTGFHAFNKLDPGRSNYIRFILWTFVILAMASYLIYTVAAELKNYYSYPMRTSFSIETKREIAFPAVTLCNQCPLNRSALGMDENLSNYFLAQSMMSKLAKPIEWGDFFTTEYSLDWWRDKYSKLELLTRMCMFQGKPVNCSTIFSPVFTESGLCYTFNGNISGRLNVSLSGADNNLVIIIVADQDNYVFNQQMSAGYKILLHEPENHPDSVKSGILAAPGFSTFISVKKTEFKYLPAPFKAFGDSECVDTTSTTFNNTLKFYKYYTYDHCLHECTAQNLFELCHCVMPNDPPLGPICSLKAQNDCYRPNLKEARTNASVQASCQCLETCKNTVYEAQVSAAGFPSLLWNSFLVNKSIVPYDLYTRNNAVELRIFYSQMKVASVEQKPEYKTATIVANLGGQMGICLGASILTLTELAEFLVFLFLYILHIFKPVNNIHKITSH